MSVPVILGAGLGTGLWALVVWLAPPRPALGAVLRRGTTASTSTASTSTASTSTASASTPALTARNTRWSFHVSKPLVGVLRAAGLPTAAGRRDLAVLEKAVDDFLAEKAVVTVGAALVPAGVAVVLDVVAGGVGISVPLAVAVGCAVVAFLAPDLRVRRLAARRRADFRHALSAYLDLVVISLAGGAGVDSALHDPLTVGRGGWAFHQLERALATARLTRVAPWSTLQQLGRELDITELTELAASASLAGTEGARVRQSLTAKAAALRSREVTDSERRAGADTERMSLPVMALLLGFLLFIGYPAVSQVLNGL